MRQGQESQGYGKSNPYERHSEQRNERPQIRAILREDPTTLIGHFVSFQRQNMTRVYRERIDAIVEEGGEKLAKVVWQEGGSQASKDFFVDEALFQNVEATEEMMRMEATEKEMIARGEIKDSGPNQNVAPESTEAMKEVLASLGRKKARILGFLEPVNIQEPDQREGRITAVEAYFTFAESLVEKLYGDQDNLGEIVDKYNEAADTLTTRLSKMRRKWSLKSVEMTNHIDMASRVLKVTKEQISEAYTQVFR